MNTDYYCYAGDPNCGTPTLGNKDAYGSKYGPLYTWTAMMNGDASVTNAPGPQGICPNGWHIPTDSGVSNATNEMWTLEKNLKDVSAPTCDPTRFTIPWDCTGAGTKMFSGGGSGVGFNFPLAGYSSAMRDTNGYLWSATQDSGDPTKSWSRYINIGAGVARDHFLKTTAYSVRCVKN